MPSWSLQIAAFCGSGEVTVWPAELLYGVFNNPAAVLSFVSCQKQGSFLAEATLPSGECSSGAKPGIRQESPLADAAVSFGEGPTGVKPGARLGNLLADTHSKPGVRQHMRLALSKPPLPAHGQFPITPNTANLGGSSSCDRENSLLAIADGQPSGALSQSLAIVGQ